MAIFSFYGVEIVAVTSGEAENPKQAIPHALKSMVLRLTLFYVLALGIMVAYPGPRPARRWCSKAPS